jgi:hypothetical protein
MTKEESLAQRQAQYASEVAQAVTNFGGGCFDDGVASVPASPGGFTQEQMDAAIAQARGEDELVRITQENAAAEALKSAQDAAEAAKNDLMKQLADKDAQDQAAMQAIKDQDAVALQAAIDAGVGAAQKFKDKSEELKDLLNKLLSL